MRIFSGIQPTGSKHLGNYVGAIRRWVDDQDRGDGLFCVVDLHALAYRANEVPVGDDQRQHVELMRDVAQRFNERFGELLVVPEGTYPQVGARIMDLQEPENKMSTTGGTPQGTVLVLDDEKTVTKKIKSAVTDSGSDVRRAPDKRGITNLID